MCDMDLGCGQGLQDAILFVMAVCSRSVQLSDLTVCVREIEREQGIGGVGHASARNGSHLASLLQELDVSQ